MTMLSQTGIYGAKRQTWKRASPRDLLKRLMDENGRASEQAIQRKFTVAVRDDEDYIDAIIEYWFANNYRSLVHKQPQVTQAARAEHAALAEVIKEKIKVAAARMVLLDMVLPNGKPLRDSTGKDCAKAGGWLSKIAAEIKPTQKVGEALSEAEVQKLFRTQK